MCGVKKGEGTFFVCFFAKLSRSEVRVGLGSFFWKVLFSLVLGSRLFANRFSDSFLILIE